MSSQPAPSPSASSLPAASALTSEMPTCNILLVDDEPSNLLALEAVLEPLGQRLVRASSGIEALRLALKMELALVLLDVQMPEMDGLETAELLRRRPRTRNVPIIFLTAISKEPSWVSRGYDVGAVDYLVKPFDPDALRTKVSTFVELAKKNAIIRAQHMGSQRELAAFKRWSERRYEDLANSLPQVVWTANASGAITYHNRRWAELSADPDEEEAAPSLRAIAHPDDVESLESGWSNAVRAGVAWEAELRLGAPSCGYRFHLVRAVPRHDEHGQVVRWVGTATDIDAKVRADRALRMLAEASDRLNGSLEGPQELEAVLRIALDVLGDGAILDVRGEGVRPERTVVTRRGVDRALLSDPRFDLGPETVAYSGRPEIYRDVSQEASSGRGAQHLAFLRELGVRAYLCLPLSIRDRVIGTVTFVRLGEGERYESPDLELAGDLARRFAVSIDNARLHATTEKRREELELANRSKDVFLATLSHELRTPLNAIVGWSDMMKGGKLDGPELARAIDTVDRNAHALSGLVADLLDVSRIVTGTLKLDAQVVSMVSVVEAAVVAARPTCSAKRIALDLERVGMHDRVGGDPGRLRQVIDNLLGNAIKFTPEGGRVTVRIEAEGPGDVVRVVVTDSGEGIAPDFLPHVFERFRQAEPGRAKGLGLGLAIVKHMIDAHGGQVRAESEGRGRGASFIVELPLAAEVHADDADDDGRTSVPASGEPELRGVHVLIVEDDPDGNELVRAILERYGATVTSAMSAASALDALREGAAPDVLVSDIGLPDMDGIELVKCVRQDPSTSMLPAVALTAYASRQDATRAIAAGFDAHVAKPVEPAGLGNAIRRLVTRRRRAAGIDDPHSPPSSTAA